MAIGRDFQAGDFWIAAFFFVALVIPGGGELVFGSACLHGLALTARDLLRRKSQTGATGVHSAIMSVVLAAASITLLKYASILWSIDSGLSWRDAATHTHFALLYPLWRALANARHPIKALILGSSAAALIVAMWAIFVVNLLQWIPRRDFEAGAQNPMVLRMLVALQVVWSVCVCSNFTLRTRHCWIVLTANLVILLTVGGRSPVVAVGFSLVMLLIFLSSKRLREPNTLRWLGFTAALLLALALVNSGDFILALNEVRAYFASTEVASSTGNRLELYRVSLLAFRDAPWLGYGAGTTAWLVNEYSAQATEMLTSRHFHNQYLQSLSEGGLIGLTINLVAFAMMIWRLVWRPWVVRHPAWPWSLGFFCIFASSALFSSVFKQGLVNAYFVFTLAVLLLWISPNYRTTEK